MKRENCIHNHIDSAVCCWVHMHQCALFCLFIFFSFIHSDWTSRCTFLNYFLDFSSFCCHYGILFFPYHQRNCMHIWRNLWFNLQLIYCSLRSLLVYNNHSVAGDDYVFDVHLQSTYVCLMLQAPILMLQSCSIVVYTWKRRQNSIVPTSCWLCGWLCPMTKKMWWNRLNSIRNLFILNTLHKYASHFSVFSFESVWRDACAYICGTGRYKDDEIKMKKKE